VLAIFQYILEAMPKLSRFRIRKYEYFDGEEKSEELLTFSFASGTGNWFGGSRALETDNEIITGHVCG